MKKQIPSMFLIAGLSLVALAGCSSGPSATTQPSSSPQTQGATNAGANGQADGPVLPVEKNPITNTSIEPGLEVLSSAVEDNVDPVTGAPIADRLQIELGNNTGKDLTGFEVFYTMTDITTGQIENYYQALTGYTLKANSTATIEFDGSPSAGHYPDNAFSLYRTSANQVDFEIEVSADGVKPATGSATKGPGAGDAAD